MLLPQCFTWSILQFFSDVSSIKKEMALHSQNKRESREMIVVIVTNLDHKFFIFIFVKGCKIVVPKCGNNTNRIKNEFKHLNKSWNVNDSS